MATFALANLCRVILKDVYGDLASQVVGILFDHGRQTAGQIAKRAKLPMSTVYRTIVALLQNRFLLYWSDAGSSVVYYYANWLQIYGVLWNGSIVTEVSERFKDDMVAEVVQNVLAYGNMKAQDYLDSYEETDRVKELVSELMSKKILSPVLDFEFHPIEDIYATMLKKHKQLIKTDTKYKSDSARLAAATISAERERDELLQERDKPNAGLLKDTNAPKTAATKKRVRRDLLNMTQHEKLQVDPEAVLQVNYDKYLVISRNAELVKLAEQRIGAVTAQVYKRVLDLYVNKLHRCKMDDYSGKEFNVSTREIAAGLGSSNLSEAIVLNSRKRAMDNGSTSNKRQKTENGHVQGEGESSEDDDFDYDNAINDSSSKNSLADVTMHLDLLADCASLPFLQKLSPQEWHVPFGKLMDSVRKTTYQSIIKNRHGLLAMRLLRIIDDKGKVEEKRLATYALSKAVDIRHKTAQLHGCGALDLQEIPKSFDRNPTKTIFLWYHNRQRAYQHVVQDLYITMHHLYSRLFAERKENATLLAKLEREDVKNNQEEYLSNQEKRELDELQTREEKLLVQIMRIDGLVKIFRDY